ncbi:MAG: hypothetical protein JO076_15675 [Verrucomicrobia bacterium]|nr:hypothetical protein [Verrucomicrobiota bacterium]
MMKSLHHTLSLAVTFMMLTLSNYAYAQTPTLRIEFNTPDMSSYAYALTLLRKQAEVLGVTIFPQDGQGSVTQQSADLMNSVNMGLDGIILAVDDGQNLSQTVEDVLAANVPIVTIAHPLNGIDRPLYQLGSEGNRTGLTKQASNALEAIVSYVRYKKPLRAFQ